MFSDEHTPQCDFCYETLCCGNTKLARLHRHLQTNHKEHVMTPAEWCQHRHLTLLGKQISVQKLATGRNNDNVVFASYEVFLLRARTAKPRTRTEEPILPADRAVASRILGDTAIGNCTFCFCIRQPCEAEY
jgi:hypothetical protein